MKKIIALLSFVLLFSATSCSLDEDIENATFIALQALDADFPDSFELGKVYEIEVTGILPNGCTEFTEFNFSRPAKTERIVVMSGLYYSDIACTQATEEVTATFIFEVLYDDPYHFKIWTGTDSQGNDVFLEYEIPVVP